jgi:hypothetical protein
MDIQDDVDAGVVRGAKSVARDWRGTQVWEDVGMDAELKQLGGDSKGGIMVRTSKSNPDERSSLALH